MESKERKEVIQLNGLTILVVMALVANFLIVGFVYRFHQWKLFTIEKAHNRTHAELIDNEHAVKEAVTELEGARSWNDTAYMRIRGLSN